MKRYLWIVLSLFFIILPGCSSDHNREYDKDKTYNVLCLFVYDSVFQNYRIYEQTLSKSLSENGIKADIARRAAERPGAQRRDANACGDDKGCQFHFVDFLSHSSFRYRALNTFHGKILTR